MKTKLLILGLVALILIIVGAYFYASSKRKIIVYWPSIIISRVDEDTPLTSKFILDSLTQEFKDVKFSVTKEGKGSFEIYIKSDVPDILLDEIHEYLSKIR